MLRRESITRTPPKKQNNAPRPLVEHHPVDLHNPFLLLPTTPTTTTSASAPAPRAAGVRKRAEPGGEVRPQEREQDRHPVLPAGLLLLSRVMVDAAAAVAVARRGGA